ncbi:MAG: TIGR01459 family HAD-type hydrolase [Alphaproteobacteria bacterium]|nr:TIGR01459 family HAD-type hydrolase [Alphaproteobacteria bacterium]
MPMRARPKLVQGVSALADRYDAFLLDQFGVLHDGTTPYDGVVPCLQALQARGKATLVLSNSAKRSAHNLERMARLGIAPSLLSGLISSGEAFHLGMADGALARRLGTSCFVIAADSDRSLLDGLTIRIVERIDDADFLLVIGLDSPRESSATFLPLLQRALARRLPMACANPDLLRVMPGGVEEAPGSVAARYEALGGTVLWFGKPHREVYRACFAALGEPPPARVLAVGDSMEHDIKGARDASIDSLLVCTGIHAPELRDASGTDIRWDALDRLSESVGAAPTYISARFSW